MENVPVGRNSSNKSPAVVVKLPGITLAGRSALVALLVFVLLIVALLAYLKPQISPSPLWVSACLWILFIVYWNAVAKNTAQDKSSESQASRSLHQNLMSIALLLLFIPIPGLGGRFLPPSFFLVPIGFAIHIGSMLLAVWARRHLGRNWSGAITVKVDHQLVCTGPYRLVRHPIYSAMLGMFVGTVIVSGTLHALLAMAIISFAYWRKIRLEEQSLGQVFGPAYDSYRRKTWALIPWLF